MRCAVVATALLLCGCATMQSAGLLGAGTTPNDVFLVEVSERLPELPYEFVSVAVVEPSRSRELPTSLSEDQVSQMRQVAASFGADQLVIERLVTRRPQAFYGFGLRTTGSTGGGLKGLPSCSHPAFPAALAVAHAQLVKCLAKAQVRRPALKGDVRLMLLVDGLGGVYQAGVTPDSTRDGVMRECGLTAAYGTDFERHGEVLCRAELQASL